MLEPDDLRFLLNLDEERFSNENLQMLIDLYTDKIVAKIKMLDPDSDALNSPLFDEALLSGIACHLSMMDPTIFLAPTKYEVGDTSEEWDDVNDANKRGIPSWCDRYASALEDLSNSIADVKNVLVFRRRGLSAHPRWCHDIGSHSHRWYRDFY